MKFGPLMLDLEGDTLAREESELLQHPVVGGVILFARNFTNREQVTGLVTEIKSLRPDMLVAVDQEGGRVQRFKEGFTRLPPMQRLGNLLTGCLPGSDEEKQALAFIQDCGWLMASEVLACGVDFSFAPVLDIDDSGCEVIADRSFNSDPEVAIKAARSFMQGMREAGMATTGKHFPGHGGVREDSHLETPYDQRSLEAIRQRDLLPFAALVNELDAVMPAHIIFPQIDKHPVGFSPFWLQQLLRQELKFDGVIFSDDLSMKGADVAGGYVEKARCAMSAGCDMVLVCNNREGAIEVLDYLDDQFARHPVNPSLQANPRLATMAKRKSPQWDDLQTDSRWQQTRRQLEHYQQ